MPAVTVIWAATDEPGWAAQSLYDDTHCEIRLSPVLFPTMNAELQCNIIVHEYGHLAGLGHSPDPANIMYFAPGPVIPECAAWQPVSHVKAKRAHRHKHRAQRKRAAARASSSR